MTLESRPQFCQTCTPTAEVGLVKPDAAIYEHTLRGLGTTPAQSMFLDDLELNVKAVRVLGIRAIPFRLVHQLRGT